MKAFFADPVLFFSAAILLRVVLFSYGAWQDAHSPVKYTDIDYYVFTDASRFIAQNQSPYERETYRYTPLLAWILQPTTWPGLWFSFGKALFAAGDLIIGWITILTLCSSAEMSRERASKFASIWLLNPMVAIISTRGSSESVLGVMVIVLLRAVKKGQIFFAGVVLGIGVHFKIYPFFYASSIVWWLDDQNIGLPSKPSKTLFEKIRHFFNTARLRLAFASISTFSILNMSMYLVYGWPFLQQTYLHHMTRIDHRHNFSPYNTLLYLSSSKADTILVRLESLAFLPQLFLTAIALPLILAKKDIASTMLAQTFVFVSFNKVCTSQYFLWYIVLLPFYLPNSSLLARKRLGFTAICLWVLTQAFWLQQAFQLEFLGKSTFVPGLWVASLLFFLTNAWILTIMISDIGLRTTKL